MNDNAEDSSEEGDLILAQQIIDDLDILLPTAGEHPGISSQPNEPENLAAVKFAGSSGLHPLYSLDPSLRLLTAARNGDLKEV